MATIGSLTFACLGCLIFLWSVVVLLVSPRIYIRIAESEQISSGFQFGDILRFTREHIGDVIIVTIMYFVASLVVGLIGSVIGVLLCVIGLIVTLPAAQLITMLIQSHLYAQVGIDKAVLQSWAYGLPEPQSSQAITPVAPAPWQAVTPVAPAPVVDMAPQVEPQPPAPVSPEPGSPDETQL